mgnify:CR=1 FL=1
MFDLVTIGDASIDTYCVLDHKEADVLCSVDRSSCQLTLDYADKIPLKSIARAVGGNAANVAVGGARLGLNTSIVATIGADDASRQVIHTLEKEDVNLEHLSRVGRNNQSVAIVYDGERTLLVHHEPREYKFTPPGATKWFYVTSMAKGSEAIGTEIAAYASENNIKIAFSPGTWQLRLGPGVMRPILTETEIIILNRDEAIVFTKSKPKTPIPELLIKLAELGPLISIITEGDKGSHAFDGQDVIDCPIATANKIESTGAGDAFSGGLVSAIIHGEDLRTAMLWGSANAASVIEHIGPQKGLLTLPQIKNKLN